MKKLYTHTDVIRVGHLKSLLESRGIACVVRNEYLGGGVGELPSNELWPELWIIDDSDATPARALLDEVLAEPAADAAPWQCPDCGELIEAQFGECWQCAGPDDGTLEA